MINFKNKSTLDPQILDRVLNEVTNQGYSLVNNYLNEDEIVIFRDLVENAVNNFEVNNNPFRLKEKYHIHDLLLQSPYFLKIFEDLRLQQLVSIFLGKFWTMYAFTSSSVPPNGSNYARRVHNDCPRFIPNYITNIGIIWPLNDYTPHNGALEVLPGSQNHVFNCSEEEFTRDSKRVFCNAGDLIIFNARLIHRTDINHTDNFRHALTLNACRHYMKPRFDWVRMIPKEFCSDLNAQALRIIGYDSQVPTSLDEYFVPPEKRLYKGGQE